MAWVSKTLPALCLNILVFVQGGVDLRQARHPLLHLHEVLAREVVAKLAPFQISGTTYILYGSRGMLTTFTPIFGRLIARPGDRQHGDEVETDLLHPQP